MPVCLFCLKGPSPGSGIANRQVQYIDDVVAIVSAQKQLKFQTKASAPFLSREPCSQPESQAYTHKCLYVRPAMSLIKAHELGQSSNIGYTIQTREVHCTAQKGREKKNGRQGS